MKSIMPICSTKKFVATYQEGFSLVELMVSITIGLILLMGLVTLLVNSSAAHTELQKSSAQIENGRYATEILSDDISLAGYYGEYSPTAYNLPEKPCIGPVVPTKPNMPAPVGYDLDSVTADFACLTNRQTGTGVLVLRRVQTVASTPVAGTTYLQVSQCNTDSNVYPFKFGTIASVTTLTGTAFTLRTSACDSTKLAAIRKVITHVYYISSCNVCSPTADSIPTLKKAEYVDGAMQTPVALVEGIEDMQFDYGIDTDGDGAPDSYVAASDTTSAVRLGGNATAPTNAANWVNVMAVRVNIMARNIQASAGYNDTKTYALGLEKPSYTVPAGSARTYKRHLYTTLVRVENPSGRRETP